MLLVSTSAQTIGQAIAPQIITLRLFVWIDDKNEVCYVYGPYGAAQFFSDATARTLKILLISDEKHGNKNRFHISHYTTTKNANIKGIKKTNVNGSIIEHSPDDESDILDGTNELFFDLDMAKGDSFYLNILLKDIGSLKGKRLISCDPQVENGTRT